MNFGRNKNLVAVKALLIFLVFPHFVLGQLPEDYSPSYLVADNAAIFVGSAVGEYLTLSVNLVKKSYCCKNFFTDQDMFNFTFKITFHNNSSRTYFARLDKFATVKPQSGIFTANIQIDSNNKRFRLDPGEDRAFYGITNMSSNNFYPTTIAEHKRLLGENPDAFEPHYVSFPFSFRYLTENQVEEIVAREIQNDEDEESVDELISNLEEDFERETDRSSANESMLEEVLSEEAGAVMPGQSGNHDSEASGHAIEYDEGLCTTLKSKATALLNHIEQATTPSSDTDNLSTRYLQLTEDIQEFNQLYVSTSGLDEFDPDCNTEIIEMMDRFYNQQITKVNELFQDLNRNAETENSKRNNPFGAFPPALMTPQFNESIPSAESGKFGKIKLDIKDKKGTRRIDKKEKEN